MQTATVDKPSCFGSHWDPKSAECRGGADPGYVDPKTGGNMRSQCSFFGPCGIQTQSGKAEALRRQQQQQHLGHNPGGIISPQSLVRPDTTRFQQPPQPQQQPQFQQRVYQQAPQVPPPQHMIPAAHAVPVQHEQFQQGMYSPMPVNYAMPGYLTVAEHRETSESIFAFAGRSILRSMLKGGAHGLAHLIDTTPLKPRTPRE